MSFRMIITTMVVLAFCISDVAYGATGDLIVNGNLGVGTQNPAGKAEINGNLIVDNNATVQGNLVTSGTTALGGNTSVSGNLTVGGTISAPNVMTKFYESPELELAVAITVAHGFGSKPKFVRVVARCKTAELGYSVGDEVDVTNVGFYNWEFVQTVANTTNITWLSNTGSSLSFINKTTNYFTSHNVTGANWRIVIYAMGQ